MTALHIHEIELSVEEARRHELPPVGLKLAIGRIPMIVEPFPRRGCYVSLQGYPGSVLEFHIENDRSGGSIVDAARCALIDERIPPMFGVTEEIELAGALRPAIACIVGQVGTMRHLAECWIHVPHRTGRLLIRASTSTRALDASCAEVFRSPALAALAASLRIVEDA